MPRANPELATVLRLCEGRRVLAVGHGRGPGHAARAGEFAAAWQAGGGLVTAVVSWPDTAASWLRHARRLVAGQPDGWVVADAPAGWARMVSRLRCTGGWSPQRTVGFAALAGPELVEALGGDAEGTSGARDDGSVWTVRGGRIVDSS